MSDKLISCLLKAECPTTAQGHVLVTGLRTAVGRVGTGRRSEQLQLADEEA